MILDPEKAATLSDDYILRVYANMLLDYAFKDNNNAFCKKIIERMWLHTKG